MRRMKSAVAGVLAVLLLVQATGCTGWKTVTEPVPAAIAQHPSRKLQVVLVDGRTINADSARASADALVTYRSRFARQAEDLSRNVYAAVADTIPLAQVKSVKVRQFSLGKTIGLAIGGLVVGLLFYAAYDFSTCAAQGRCSD